MFKNFFQYLFMVLMIHFVLKKIMLDKENFNNFHEYQNSQNTPSDFNDEYKLVENYETDEESEFDNLKANIDNIESDDEEEEEETKIENNIITGINGNDSTYSNFDFGNDTLNLEHHVKGVNTDDFETTFDLNVPTNKNDAKAKFKNEGIMNGGSFMDNIHGFDNLDSNFASL